ncbi:hypothetical protein HDU81_005338, partial [Chytriomyces hyalinus]
MGPSSAPSGAHSSRKTSDRRAAQNRQAQKNWREKKDKRISELEVEVQHLVDENRMLRGLLTSVGIQPPPSARDATGSMRIHTNQSHLPSTSGPTLSHPQVPQINQPIAITPIPNAANSSPNAILDELLLQFQDPCDFEQILNFNGTRGTTGTDTTADLSESLFSNNNPSPSNSANNELWLDIPPDNGASNVASMSAFNLLGQPQLLQTRFALKTLDSLKDSPLVDGMLDAFVAQSKETDPKRIKKHLIQILKLRHKLLDTCSSQDRIRAVEILEHCKVVNLPHVMHLYQSGVFPGMPSTSQDGDSGTGGDSVTDVFSIDNLLGGASNAASVGLNGAALASSRLDEDISAFRKAVMANVPSLVHSNAVVDELCDLFKAQASCAEKKEREDAFFKSQELGQRLLNLCPISDRTRPKIIQSGGRQPPNAKRTQQVRDAQRKYRMRKELRIAELTAEVAGLTERIAELEGLNASGGFAKQEGIHAQTPPCFMCETERIKSAQYLDRIQWLERRLAEAETSAAQPFLISPVSAALSLRDSQPAILPEVIAVAEPSFPAGFQTPLACAPQIASSPSLPASVHLSAASLFGGPPNVEFHKKALKLVPSLKECSWVDTLYDTFVAQSFLTDRKSIKTYAIKVLTAKFRLFDSCNCPEDRRKAVEL